MSMSVWSVVIFLNMNPSHKISYLKVPVDEKWDLEKVTSLPLEASFNLSLR